MTPEQFAFWLHGYFEISRSDVLSEAQVKKIKENLEVCFNKVTPRRNSITKLLETTDADGYKVFHLNEDGSKDIAKPIKRGVFDTSNVKGTSQPAC